MGPALGPGPLPGPGMGPWALSRAGNGALGLFQGREWGPGIFPGPGMGPWGAQGAPINPFMGPKGPKVGLRPPWALGPYGPGPKARPYGPGARSLDPGP